MSNVQDVRNAWGSWTINWRDNTPLSIRAAADPEQHTFSLVRIYASRISADLVDVAPSLWTGLLMTSDAAGIGGPGPSWLAGTPGGSVWEARDEAGPFTGTDITYNGTSNGTLTAWVTSLLSLTLSGLTPGFIGGPATLVGGTITARTVRTVLDSFLKARFGVEWRINPDLTVDVGYRSELYPDTNPPIATKAGGRDGETVTLQATDLGLSSDWAEWITKAVIREEGSGTLYGSSSESIRKNPGSGGDLNWRHISDADGLSAAEFGSDAQRRFLDSGRTRSATISAREYGITDRIPPGAAIDIWDPADGFYDLTRNREHRGQLIHPVRIRVEEVNWPIQAGMGVWLDRRNITDDPSDLVDLTDHIEFEPDDADTTITVGSLPRALGGSRRK